MQNITRKPSFFIKVIRPNYSLVKYSDSAEDVIASFYPKKKVGMSLLSYEFKETLQVTDCTFSLSFTAEADERGLTWFDKIKPTDIVKIYEINNLKFVGLVTDRRYATRMVDDGAQRTISISGVSIVNLLSRFILILDTFLYDSDTFAGVENILLNAALAEKMGTGFSVAPMLEDIYNSFFDLVLKTGRINNTGAGVKALIDYFVVFGSDLSSDIVARYPIALSIYNPGENNIWSILVSLIAPPINELFPKFDPSDGKYHVVFRQAPFDSADWAKLPLNKIPSIILSSCDFGSNDAEVYTFYLVTLAGSGINDRKALVLNEEYKNIAERDTDKWKKYGYKPLIVEFKYFDKDYYEETADVATTMHVLSVMLRTWFEHNDEFLNGSIEFMTIDESWWDNVSDPRIGERLSFLDGEFYIEASEHSWAYGEAMRTRLGISRGYVYTQAGVLQQPIPNPGRKADAILRKGLDIEEGRTLLRR